MRLYWRVLRSSKISSESYGFKNQKVSKSGPTELNETTPQHKITSQKFSF